VTLAFAFVGVLCVPVAWTLPGIGGMYGARVLTGCETYAPCRHRRYPA
jgi:hypothetical protein